MPAFSPEKLNLIMSLLQFDAHDPQVTRKDTIPEKLFLFSLLHLINAKKVIEIGVNFGQASAWIAAAICDLAKPGTLICVDNWSKAHGGSCTNSRLARARLKLFIPCETVNVEFFDGSSSDYFHSAKIPLSNAFDATVIDGDHSYEGCLKDLNFFCGRSKYLIVHDTNQLYQGPRKACEDFVRTYKTCSIQHYFVDGGRGYCLINTQNV